MMTMALDATEGSPSQLCWLKHATRSCVDQLCSRPELRGLELLIFNVLIISESIVLTAFFLFFFS
jgi:hypothetical protein